ncbi:hypothetical protein E4U27_001919, partial [Claviceps purpurea]
TSSPSSSGHSRRTPLAPPCRASVPSQCPSADYAGPKRPLGRSCPPAAAGDGRAARPVGPGCRGCSGRECRVGGCSGRAGCGGEGCGWAAEGGDGEL